MLGAVKGKPMSLVHPTNYRTEIMRPECGAPECAACGAQMWLFQIERSSLGYDRREFQCRICGRTKTEFALNLDRRALLKICNSANGGKQTTGKGILLWLFGVPISIIILLALFLN